jgi:flagellar hook protein FlgE
MDDVSSTGRPRQSQSGRDSSMWAGMESLEGRVYLAGIDPALSRAVTEYLGSKPATAALAEANLTDGNIEESGGVPIVSSLPIFLRQFSVGLQFQNTGVPTDLAIDGSGFFIVSDADGAKVAFTRDGAFSISGKNQLVDAAGQVVNGHTVDEGFVLGNTLVPLAIPPSGVTAIAKATGTTSLVGTLDTAGTVGTTGTVLTSTRLFTAGGGAVSAATTLQSLTSTRGGTVPLFGTLTALTFTPSIGATTLPTQTLVVNSQTTVGDLENFLTNGFGIDTGTAASGVAQAGATIQNDRIWSLPEMSGR